MKAFHSDPKIKEKYLARVRAHAAADEISSGVYYEKHGKKLRACAVGCTIHGDSHAKYETELGIPQVLARLEDRLFEGMYRGNPELAKAWPERFLSAPQVGADLAMVWPIFAHWMLIDPENGVIRFAKKEWTKAAIEKVAALYAQWIAGDKPSRYEWNYAATAYADTAHATAAYAATTTTTTTDAYATTTATAAAAYAAADATAAYAYAAADATAYAATAYADTAHATAAYAATRSKHFAIMADKLIELIESCQP